MVTERCQTLESLAAIGGLAADDPRRIHVDGCPRCRARLGAYRAFMASDRTSGLNLDMANLAAARNQLDAALTREIYSSEGPPADRDRRPGRLEHFVATAWRPVLAAAAILVLVVGLNNTEIRLELPSTSPGSEPVLRGGVEQSQIEQPLQIEAGPDQGTWLLTWRTPDRASASTVVLYDTGLAEVARLDASEAETFLLRRDSISAPDRVAFLRIVFDANGDEIGRSQARTLTF